MEITGNIMELGMSRVGQAKSAQAANTKGAGAENTFAQDMQRASQKADKRPEPKQDRKAEGERKPEAPEKPEAQQSPKAEEGVANEEANAKVEDKIADESATVSEEEANPEMLAMSMAQLMAALQQQPEVISEDEGMAPETDLAGVGNVLMAQEQENVVQTVNVTVDDEAANVLSGEANEETVITEEPTTKQEAKFAEQVLSEIKQAVASNEAERTVSAQPSEQVEQEVQVVEAVSEYDENIDTKTQTKTQKPEDVVQEKEGNTMPEQNMPQLRPEAPVAEVAFKDGQIAPREVQQTFFEGVLDQVQTAVTENQTELYVRLKPEVLGGLAIKLIMTEQGLSAQVRTNNQQLEQLVRAEITQLEANLKDRGIDVIDMEVIYDQSANNQYLNQQQHQRGWGGGGSSGQGSRNMGRIVEEAAMLRPYEQMYESMVPTEGIADESVEYSA